MDRTMIERYAAGARVPLQWIEGLSREELNATPVAGKWSVQQVVLHVLDSDLIATHRMRRMVAEENPLLLAYDETLFAVNLFYERMEARRACELFALNREFTVEMLRMLPDAAFERTGVHNQRGKITLAQTVESYVRHVEHHGGFVAEKRRVLGKGAHV